MILTSIITLHLRPFGTFTTHPLYSCNDRFPLLSNQQSSHKRPPVPRHELVLLLVNNEHFQIYQPQVDLTRSDRHVKPPEGVRTSQCGPQRVASEARVATEPQLAIVWINSIDRHTARWVSSLASSDRSRQAWCSLVYRIFHNFET